MASISMEISAINLLALCWTGLLHICLTVFNALKLIHQSLNHLWWCPVFLEEAIQVLWFSDLIKDLGIVFDRKITFDLHVNYVISRSLSILGFVKRFGKELSDPYVLKTIYSAFVHSVLESGSCVWSLNFEVHRRRIESVQRKFLRFALRGLGWSDPFNLPAYEDRCNLLNLQTLANRRDIFCS
jgi:hypothetical protein